MTTQRDIPRLRKQLERDFVELRLMLDRTLKRLGAEPVTEVEIDAAFKRERNSPDRTRVEASRTLLDLAERRTDES
ncbi:hypothetical protein KO481_07910 [Nocardia sp. NEAU-G5]|uniref:Uncharacterized protein n=1 Tax=Nocardia albiluteola TaxID=2842303 RepID=A0ABS6ATU1_9NOCA|nr:hypothetical protein [Nocardia albiluteola]MBU3061446.1 hypothetical protein [Nocardia albiluteola]